MLQATNLGSCLSKQLAQGLVRFNSINPLIATELSTCWPIAWVLLEADFDKFVHWKRIISGYPESRWITPRNLHQDALGRKVIVGWLHLGQLNHCNAERPDIGRVGIGVRLSKKIINCHFH